MADKQIENNRRYNAERKAQAELMKRDLDRDKVLAQIYQESFDRMQREIDSFYMRYAGREGLTKQEAIKRAAEMDVTRFADKAAKAVREKDFSHATNEWLKVYNLKMKVSRLELLRAELTLEIQNLTAEVNEVFDKARTDEYLNEYKRQAGILGISSSGAKKRMQAILGADFYGQKFSARVWGGLGLGATLQRDVFGSLNRIFTDMMGYKQEMKRLAKKYGTSEANAKRLLKTEIARINADTQYDMLKDNGFTHMIFVAEPGACDLCEPLDKVAVPIEDVEKGVNMYPMHPNCRCSAYGHIKMDYKAGGSTLDREAVNGVWGEDKQTEAEKTSQKQITGTGRKLLAFEEDEVFVASNPEEIDDFFKKQKSYQKWYNGLTDDERSAIYSYTTENYHNFNNIKRYGIDKAIEIRKKFWLDSGESSEDLPFVIDILRDTVPDVKVLDNAISNFAPDKTFKAFRGSGSVSALGEDLGYLNFEVGQTVTLDKAFTSFSLDRQYAESFARDGDGADVLFEVTIKKGQKTGAYIAELADFNPEKEYLMKPDLKYKVMSKVEDDNGLIVYNLEVLADGIG